MDHLISACNETLCWEYSSHDLSHFGWFNVKLWAWLINRGHPNRGGLLLKRIPNKQTQGWCLVCASWTLGHWYVCTGEQSGTPPCHQIKLNPRNITNFYFAFFVIMMLQWVPKSLPVIPTSAVFFYLYDFYFYFYGVGAGRLDEQEEGVIPSRVSWTVAKGRIDGKDESEGKSTAENQAKTSPTGFKTPPKRSAKSAFQSFWHPSSHQFSKLGLSGFFFEKLHYDT